MIEYPLEGMTETALENLRKMVEAKAPLIKKALSVGDLPIEVKEDRICFPWFAALDNELATAYAQFITSLCDTAKKKKRIIANPRESFENEKFSMRIFMVELGMIGDSYKFIRKQMMANLCGNAAWRFGIPEKAPQEAEIPAAILEASFEKVYPN